MCRCRCDGEGCGQDHGGPFLVAMLVAGAAFAQRQGGVLKIYLWDSPASMSIHEQSTIAAEGPMMGVFNNLVMYKQDVPHAWGCLFDLQLCLRPVSAGRWLVCGPLRRAAHADGLRIGVVDHDNRDRGGERAGFAVCRALRARHGRRRHLAGGQLRRSPIGPRWRRGER
jgi:hypothetical protein